MQTPRSAPFTRRTIWLIASPLVILALVGIMTDNAEARARRNVAYASVAALKVSLGDRHDLELDNVRITDAGAACIHFQARDALGSLRSAQAVVVAGEVAKSGAREGRFEKEWNRQCLGMGHDVTSAVDRFF